VQKYANKSKVFKVLKLKVCGREKQRAKKQRGKEAEWQVSSGGV